MKIAYSDNKVFQVVILVFLAICCFSINIVHAHHSEKKAKRPTSQFLAIGNSIGFDPKDPENANAYREKAGKIMKEEAKTIWKYYTDETIRQIYIVDAISHNHENLVGKEAENHNAFSGYHLHKDAFAIIAILECEDIHVAREKLSALPFVKANLVDFQIYSLMPYIMLPEGFSEDPP